MASAQRPRTSVHRRRLWLAVAVVGAIAAGVGLATGGGGGPGLAALPTPVAVPPPGSRDPFAYAPGRQADFIARATAGQAHVLYAKSPDGAAATAARVAQFAPLIQRASAGTGVDPATLEGIVFLESAGFPNEITGPDVSSAAGLTQILADTGTSLLGMRIDLAKSRQLTQKILAAQAAGRRAELVSLEAQRAKVDDRFDPAKALSATVRYLNQAQARFGRSDLALESYHMGIGNLAGVLADYGAGSVPYVQLYFDNRPGPPRHGLPAAVLVRRRLLDLLLARPGRRADHAAVPLRSVPATPPGLAADRRRLCSGGPAPARSDAWVRRSRGAEPGLRPGGREATAGQSAGAGPGL